MALSQDVKDVGGIIAKVVSVVLWLAFNFVVLMLAVPALVSAASTIAVVAGFTLLIASLIFDLAILLYIIRSINKKEVTSS